MILQSLVGRSCCISCIKSVLKEIDALLLILLTLARLMYSVVKDSELDRQKSSVQAWQKSECYFDVMKCNSPDPGKVFFLTCRSI